MGAKRDPTTGLTPQQERFAQELASGKDQSAAFRAAYPRSKAWQPQVVWAKASVLAANGTVRERVAALSAALREEAERKLRFGLPEALAQADEAYECGRQFEQAGAMVSAITLKARLAGLLVPKPQEDDLVPGLTPELARKIRARLVETEHEPAPKRRPRRSGRH